MFGGKALGWGGQGTDLEARRAGQTYPLKVPTAGALSQ